MRLLLIPASVVALALPASLPASQPAWAQPAANPVAPLTGTTTTNPPAASAPAATSGRPHARAPRQTLAQRFEAADTSKDGHLTQDEASAARWTYLTRNFDVIDKAHKGYVTTDDIRAYSKERRAQRHAQHATKKTEARG